MGVSKINRFPVHTPLFIAALTVVFARENFSPSLSLRVFHISPNPSLLAQRSYRRTLSILRDFVLDFLQNFNNLCTLQLVSATPLWEVTGSQQWVQSLGAASTRVRPPSKYRCYSSQSISSRCFLIFNWFPCLWITTHFVIRAHQCSPEYQFVLSPHRQRESSSILVVSNENLTLLPEL